MPAPGQAGDQHHRLRGGAWSGLAGPLMARAASGSNAPASWLQPALRRSPAPAPRAAPRWRRTASSAISGRPSCGWRAGERQPLRPAGRGRPPGPAGARGRCGRRSRPRPRTSSSPARAARRAGHPVFDLDPVVGHQHESPVEQAQQQVRLAGPRLGPSAAPPQLRAPHNWRVSAWRAPCRFLRRNGSLISLPLPSRDGWVRDEK